MTGGIPHYSMKMVDRSAKACWHVFREHYPHLAAGLALGIAALILADITLVFEDMAANRQQARMNASLVQADAKRSAERKAAEEHLAAASAERARREALTARGLHLAIDCGNKVMSLRREGALLREMPVRLREPAPGTGSKVIEPAPPRGRHVVVALVDKEYRFEVPEEAFRIQGIPVPVDRTIAGALGPDAVILNSGALIYSLPETGPLSDPRYLIPGAVRVETADLRALKESLRPGMAVYFY